MAAIIAMHAGHSEPAMDYDVCPDLADSLDDTSVETNGNMADEEPENEHTPFMNLITRGYNSIQLSEKTSDIKVFHISKGKQFVRAIRLFFKICCCILYVLQTIELPETGDLVPAYCKHLHLFLPFNPNPAHNSVLEAYQLGKCSGDFNYHLIGSSSSQDHLFQHNKSLLRFNDLTELNNDVKSHFCSFLCNSTETCADVTRNDFYEFCSCIVDCGGQLICNSAMEHEESFSREISKYDYSKLLFYPKSLPLYFVQAVFSIIVMLEAIIGLIWSYYNGGRWFSLIDGYVVLDLVNGFLFIITLCFPPCLKDLFIPIFIQCLSAKSMLNEIIYEFDTYNRQSKYFNVLTQKLISLLFAIGSVLFFSVCIMHYLERTHVDSSIPNLFESLWFIIITITTVGYGDIYPQTWYGKVFIMILVILVLFSLTTVLDELLELFGSSHKTTAAYFNYVKGRHVVLVTSHVRMNFLVDFINELYSEKNNDLVTVILCPRAPDKITENRLKSPLWRRRVVLLQGSALRFIDLDRACLANAKCCFVIPDRQTDDPSATDHEIVLRAIAIRRFAPHIKLYVHILKPENRFQVDFATKVMCEGEVKPALFASNCICPGFSSFITLLLHTTTPDSDEKHQDFAYCSGNEIYDIRLGDSVLFSQYVNKNFLFTAVLVLRNSGVLLIGIKKGDNNKILLNPGSDYILQENDTCFYISQNREEQSRVVDKVPKYDAKNELEKMCAQVGLINLHYYNMDQELESSKKIISEATTPDEEHLGLKFNNNLRKTSLKDELMMMQFTMNDKVDEVPDNENMDSDYVCPERKQSIRDGIMIMQAAATNTKYTSHYKFEKADKTNLFRPTESLDVCDIPLEDLVCPDSVFEQPPLCFDRFSSIPCDTVSECPELGTVCSEDLDCVQEKCPADSGKYRQFHSYNSCSYPRKKIAHTAKKAALEPPSKGGGGLSKILRQSQKGGAENIAKKKPLKPQKGKFKARISKLNLFDNAEPHTEAKVAIRDEQEQNELHQLEDNFNLGSRIEPEPIPRIKNSIGIPPVRPYVGSSDLHCHLISPATRQCCLQLGWKMQCHDSPNFKSTREQYRPEDPCVRKLYPFLDSNAIIVAADDTGPQLYHLILPLRSQYLPFDQLQPIVLLIPTMPEASFLEAVSWLPQVYFIIGSAEVVDDLLIAGVLKADAVILCVGDGVHEEKDEIHMTDASRINIVLQMRKVFPNTPFYVELYHRSNIRFLSSRNQGFHMHRRNPDDFLSTPYFKSGHVFSPSMLDTIIYQSAEKDYIIELVRLMLGLEQREGSAYLARVDLSLNDVKLYQNYGRIMQKLACDRKDLAIGIYRTEMQKHISRSETLRYEKVQEYLRFKLQEFKIDNVEIPRLPDRSKYSYVLVNPDAALALNPNDVVLVLRCNNFPDTQFIHKPPLLTTTSLSQGLFDTESDSDDEKAEQRKSALSMLKRSFTFKSKDESTKSRRSSSVSDAVQIDKVNIRTTSLTDRRGSSKNSTDKNPSPRKFLDLSPIDDTIPGPFKKHSFDNNPSILSPIEVESPEISKSLSINTLTPTYIPQK